MSDYALQFIEANKSLLNLGTLGNLGGQLSDGFYLKFDVKTTQLSSLHGFGIYASNASSRFWLEISHTISIVLGENTQNGKKLGAYATNYKKLNNGERHTVEIQMYPATNVITIKIDEVVQGITYTFQGTPAAFNNFTGNVYFGARNNNQFNNAFERYFTGVLDNIKIGTSSGAVYGSWGLNEGSGTTSTDLSGNGRTATLTNGSGGSIPTWVTGLKRIYINIGSEVWKVGTDLQIKVSGSWKKVKRAYIQISGDWKVIY